MANKWVLVRAGARGLTAAMAMSGVRNVTANLGLVGETPPESITEKHGPGAFQRMSPEVRQALTEAVHWAYGAGGGVMFGLLPARVRAHPWSGPVYGTAVWLGFELGLGPALGVQGRQGGVVARAMLVIDHALYGVVVAGRLAPAPEPIERERRG